MQQVLEGITIADFTQMMQGPWATQKLADMGADVIKIERIGGEWERKLEAGGELYDGVSPFFLAMNRNKRSVTLDLKSEAGQQAALDIAAAADAVVENFRPSVMERFGIGYEDVNEVNPEVVYVSASGFGSDGPYVDRPGQDLLLQAMSGLANYTGRKGDPPTPVGTAVVDEHSATLIALHTMFALFHKERTGEGQKVEANLLNAALDFQCQELTAAMNTDREFERSESGVAQAWLGGPYGIYETVDGYVAIAMTPMDVLADTTGIDAFRAVEDTFAKRDVIKRQLEEYTRQQLTEDLLEELLADDIWAAAVADFDDVQTNPQIAHNDMIIELDHPAGGTFRTIGAPVEHSKTPASFESGPPSPGQHTEKVLADVGYDEARIAELKENGVAE